MLGKQQPSRDLKVKWESGQRRKDIPDGENCTWKAGLLGWNMGVYALEGLVQGTQCWVLGGGLLRGGQCTSGSTPPGGEE